MVLITGCSGLLGNYLIKKFVDTGSMVIGIDLVPPKIKIDSDRFKFIEMDLTDSASLTKFIQETDLTLVINAFGIKGSPIRAKESPVDFLYPSFKINTDIIHECYKKDIWLFFISSVGVYSPAEKFVEDDMWKSLPSEADWFPSWSKRTGELLLEAYAKQYNYKKWTIMRPANIFGEYDDFSGNGTVIASTIKKIFESNGTIDCWGDGSPVRDFVFAEDVAFAIHRLYNNQVNDVVNFGSGEEITIKTMIENLIEISGKDIKINWDPSKPNGDMRRQMDITKQEKYHILPNHKFKHALRRTYYYYISQFNNNDLNFNLRDFLDKGYYIGKTTDIIKDNGKFEEMIKKIKEQLPDMKGHYRYEYNLLNSGLEEYPHAIQFDEIEERDKFVKERDLFVIQKWGEYFLNPQDDFVKYFRGVVEEYIPKLYPDLKNNISHNDAITLYKDGDFITPHTDGMNAARYCVILIYLNNPSEYNDGGGRLIVGSNKEKTEYVNPTTENFVILDFTSNEVLHAVEPVKNGFERLTYINFIHNMKMI